MAMSYAQLYLMRKRWLHHPVTKTNLAWNRLNDQREKIYIPTRMLFSYPDRKPLKLSWSGYTSTPYRVLLSRRKDWKIANSWIMSIR